MVYSGNFGCKYVIYIVHPYHSGHGRTTTDVDDGLYLQTITGGMLFRVFLVFLYFKWWYTES